jgi:hypothetical protein
VNKETYQMAEPDLTSLTDEERLTWNALYAAQFVALLSRVNDMESPRAAELAVAVANRGTLELRSLRGVRGKINAGRILDLANDDFA